MKIRPDFHGCLAFPLLFSDLEKLGSVCVAFSTCGITDLILVSSILLFGYSQITASRHSEFVGNAKGCQPGTKPCEQEEDSQRKWPEKQWMERQEEEKG